MGDFFTFAVVGFFAQLVDGALGMGFGVISSALLLSQGVPPPLVSAAVNAAKLPTSGTSATSHYLHGNILPEVVRPVLICGAIGGILGALLLTSLKGPWLQVLTICYLVVVGGLILIRAVRGVAPALVGRGRYRAIGFSGGVIEGIGGSWGPIVTTGLLGSGVSPRYAVGSSNVAELAVSLGVFLVLVGTYSAGHWGGESDWQSMIMPVLGLTVGGVPAAIYGGKLARITPQRPLTFAVGALAIGVAIYRAVTL